MITITAIIIAGKSKKYRKRKGFPKSNQWLRKDKYKKNEITKYGSKKIFKIVKNNIIAISLTKNDYENYEIL